MITKQTKEYGDLFRQASEDLKKYNTSYQLISDPKTQDKTPILKTNYVVIELTADDYVPKTYYIQKSEGVYEIDNSLTFTPGQTYYYDAAEQITSLDEYFSYIEDLNHINRKYTILPLDEEPFVIDANTRTITVPKSFKTNGISVQGDEAAETIYFKIDRFFDATDLDMMDIYVQWRSSEIDEEGNPVEKVSPIWVKDIESQPGYIIFGWPISSKATVTDGKIQFSVRFYKYDRETERLTYSLSTLTCVAEIKPSLNFDLPGIIKDGKERIDDATNLINNRFVNSTGITGGTPAAEPLFVKDLEGKPFVDEKGNNVKEAFLDKKTGILKDHVEAVSTDGGAITYTWKKYNIDTNERMQGLDSNGQDVMPYETVHIESTDKERNPNKLYYISSTISDGLTPVYTLYKGAIPPEDEETIIYEKVSQGTMNSVGKYIVTSTNRVKQSRKTADSTMVYIKKPSEVVVEESFKDSLSAIIPPQAKDSDVPGSVTLNVKATTQDTVDKKPNDVTYQWYKKPITAKPDDKTEWEKLTPGGTGSSYMVTGYDAVVGGVHEGDGYYKAIVTNTLNKEATSTESKVCRVTHKASVPAIKETTDLSKPVSLAKRIGFSIEGSIPADAGEAGRTDQDTFEYQWFIYRYSNINKLQEDREKAEKQEYLFDKDLEIVGATKAKIKLEDYTIPAAADSDTWAGLTIFCQVTNVYNGTKAVRCSRFFDILRDAAADGE